MAGQLKEVRGRIKSVINTQQITKAMKMVSAAKLRRATDRIVQMRPYANKLNDMLSNIASGADVAIDFARDREVKNVLIVLITSDRGLAGAFNSTLVKLAKQTISKNYADQYRSGNVRVMTIGKKGLDGMKKQFPVISEFQNIFSHLHFEKSAEASTWILKAFQNKEIDRVEIIYSQFKNAATQLFTVERFLPIAKSGNTAKKSVRQNFAFEPHQEKLIAELVPKILNTQFFKCLLDSFASEQGARMTAMDKATDNAKELLKELSIKYNRARQAAITTELTEIVSGAAALSEK